MNKKFTTKDIHESPMIMILPLVILSFGAIFSGYFFKDILIGNESKNFWLNSIFFLETFLHGKIPFWFLLLTPVLVISAIPLSYYFYVKNKKGYQVIKAPVGAIVPAVPDGGKEQKIDGQTYMVYKDVYYQPIVQNGKNVYQVVEMSNKKKKDSK